MELLFCRFKIGGIKENDRLKRGYKAYYGRMHLSEGRATPLWSSKSELSSQKNSNEGWSMTQVMNIWPQQPMNFLLFILAFTRASIKMYTCKSGKKNLRGQGGVTSRRNLLVNKGRQERILQLDLPRPPFLYSSQDGRNSLRRSSLHVTCSCS